MEKIKKNQHKLILNMILNSPKNIHLKLKQNDSKEIEGTVFTFENDEVTIKTTSGYHNIPVTFIDEMFILN